MNEWVTDLKVTANCKAYQRANKTKALKIVLGPFSLYWKELETMDQAKQTQFKAEFEENGKPRVSLIFMFLFFIQHTHTPHLFFLSQYAHFSRML